VTTPAPTTKTETAPETPEGSRVGGLVRFLLGQNSIWILLAFILIAVIFSVLEPRAFPTQFNWTNIAINASILLILATGQTFVIATSGIDLSVGSVLVFSSVVATKTMVELGERTGDPNAWGAILGGLLAGLLAGIAWGVLNGFLVAVAKVPPLIVTLGSMGMAMGFAQIITGGNDVRGVPTDLISTVGSGRLLDTIPYLVLIALAVALVAGYVLNRTRFGRFTLAIGSDEEASRRNGLPVRRHIIKVYGLAGLLAGLAGFLSVARFGATTINGHATANLDTIAAVVLGGTSLFGGLASVFGTTVGVFIPTVLKNGFTIIGVQPFWQNVAVGAVLIAAVYYDQQRRRSRSRR
jgi:ribose transport system permease protein